MKIVASSVVAWIQGGREERGSSRSVVGNSRFCRPLFHPIRRIVSVLTVIGLVLGLHGPVSLRSQSPSADTFNPEVGLGWDSAPSSIISMAVQTDGKVLVGGFFETLGGQPRKYIGRLNPDGTLDTGFNPGVAGPPIAWVGALVVQPDRKILVGGGFTNLAGQVRSCIGRLNADGTVDTGFSPNANSSVEAIALQPDGRILVGGFFTNLAGQARNGLGRLNPDGTLDNEFNPLVDSPAVFTVALQADGKILVGGGFTNLAGRGRSYLGRLNPDGSLDEAFNPQVDSRVDTIAVQGDGKILIGKTTTTVRQYLVRLNSDGALDGGFNSGTNFYLTTIVPQADGKILAGTTVTAIDGQVRTNLARLLPDGKLDSAFDPRANGRVASLAVQLDGKLLVSGKFSALGGQPRSRFGRLNATEPAFQSLNYDANGVLWTRTGTSPELAWASFEASSDGLAWARLGEGVHVPGGWRLTNVTLPPQTSVRARGYVSGGYRNGSGWIVEDYWGLPAWTAIPTNRTNSAGATATFAGRAIGFPSVSYQWAKGGIPLLDGGRISGATTTTLTLTNVLGGDAGAYQLIASNQFGSRTSAVATLTIVNDPTIAVSPSGYNREPGQSVTMSFATIGTMPLAYQWWKDGLVLAGRTEASLTITNLILADAGSYWVQVVNQYGSATSAMALLTVNGVTLDDGFTSGTEGAPASVYSLALQADGKILVAGRFINLAGQARKNIGRLDSGGALDAGFNPGANSNVFSVAVQRDGKILLAGRFTTLAGQARNGLARLNSDGSLDVGFRPEPNSSADALALQDDGKILVGGSFTVLGGLPRTNLARLNPDGSLDGTFNPAVNSSVASIAPQADGKILIGGSFTLVNGQPRSRIARLNADGTLDTGFSPGAGGSIQAITLQSDGQILVAGGFTNFAGLNRRGLVRLTQAGTLDSGFDPLVNGSVHSLALQSNGKILIGGNFDAVSGQTRSRLARLNPDGSLDVGFNPGPGGASVYGFALQEDGKILVSGAFTLLSGQARNSIGRLNATEPTTQNLNYDGSTIAWQRGGSAPGVWRTTFEWSGDGLQWNSLGEGEFVPGGWQKTNVFVPVQSTIRARGFVTGGLQNGSAWFVEDYLCYACPLILNVERNVGMVSNQFGFNASASGSRVMVEASSNLIDWVPVFTNSATNGVFRFLDPDSYALPNRYFRTLMEP